MRRLTSKLPASKRRWLWLWLQDRRRGRASATIPASPLLNGLVQFYKPQANATFLKSWGEGEAVPSDPFLGIGEPYAVGAAGTYALEDAVRYDVFPYREGAQRIYAGAVIIYSLGVEADGSGILWPAWSSSPGWVSGFSVVRYVNGAYAGFRYVPAATMFAGWTDSGSGWSLVDVLPCSYSNPPTTAKVIWSCHDWTVGPTAIPTVMSPFGGVAFSSLVGDRLQRMMSDDLRRSLDGTLAFWMCPGDLAGGVAATVRGVYSGGFFGDYYCEAPNMSFGLNGEIAIADHQDGDWYLVVMRNDMLSWTFTLDLLRARDAARFSGIISELTPYTALNGEEDYLAEGVLGLLAVGSSAHWDFQAWGYFDLIGIWNRALIEDEVLDLFNCGLAWQPN